jgi:hypothetical protein
MGPAAIRGAIERGDRRTARQPRGPRPRLQPCHRRIRHHLQGAKAARDDVRRELTEAEFEEIKSFGTE